MGVFCIFVRSNILQMRRLTLLIFLFFAFFSATNGQWTIETVPNTRLQSNEIHISDPDDYLSDSAEMNINTALSAIRDQADVFVVTLSSIGEAEPKRFATQLFNHWGIGDAETDNGVLLLFVEDQHALEFETGYGAEATLTDAKCERIFTKTIVPYFREGDYEGGLCAGVGEIVSVYGGEIPMGLITILPSDSNEGSGKLDEDFSPIFLLFALIMFVMPILGIVFWLYKRNKKSAVSDTYHSFEEDGATYVDGLKNTWSGSPWEGKGCLGGLTLGFSIFVILFVVITFMTFRFPDLEEKQQYDWISVITLLLYLTWICFRQNHRALKTADKLAKLTIYPKEVYKAAYNNIGTKIATWMAPWLGWVYRQVFKKRIKQSGDFQCPMCHLELKKDGGFALPEVHALENRLGALKFTPYRCSNGHKIVLKEHGSQYSKFQACPTCGAFTSKLVNTKTIREADYSQSGEREMTYECQHCGNSFKKAVTIPMLYHYTGGSSYSSGSSSSRSYSSHSSSHSSSRSSGSFGGGRSGGGGYSGKW
jgi:uncharacterized protein